MKPLLRVFKHDAPRESASAVVDTSASAPDFGSASINNSTGASAAISDLAQHLDGLLKDFDSNDDFAGQRRVAERKLNLGADKYSNSRLRDEAEPWKPNQNVVDVLIAAVKCSVAVYAPASIPHHRNFNFKTLHAIAASTNGVTKATSFTLVNRNNTYSAANDGLPALVVAIRGSKDPIDWVVNANHEERQADALFDSADWLGGRKDDIFKVHSGFWNAASALLAKVKEQVAAADRARTVKHIIFTGHSAGGAVASLLYLHMLGIASKQHPALRFSLVTFGSPPVTSPSVMPLVTKHLKAQNRPGSVLAIVNESDPVPRSSRDYLLSLVDLFGSIDGQPPAHGAQNSPPLGSAPGYWHLPPPTLYTVGCIVVLRDTDPNGDDSSIGAFRVSEGEFNKLLFCSGAAHGKDLYDANIEELTPS